MSDPVRQIPVSGGRSLAYALYGDPEGRPLFFFHGGNDSRLEAALLHETAARLGWRIIAPDRPGYGRSSFQPDRTFADWPADVAILADHLDLARFVVAGHSGGGPHALAVAHDLPDRVDRLLLISSAGPPGSSNTGMHPMFRAMNFFMGHSAALHRRITVRTADQVRRNPAAFFAQWGRASAADGRVFARPEIAALIAAEMQEALHQGTDAILQEHPLYKKAWGFDIASIQTPAQIWHGDADVQAAPAWSRALADLLPVNRFHLIADEGHFSVLVNQQAPMLESLTTEI